MNYMNRGQAVYCNYSDIWPRYGSKLFLLGLCSFGRTCFSATAETVSKCANKCADLRLWR